MKNSSPADEQPVEVSTVPTRSLAGNNANEKEQDQASLPSGSTSSEEQAILSPPIPGEDISQDAASHAASPTASTTAAAQTSQTRAAKRGMSSTAKWLVAVIIALVLIAGGVAGLFIFLLPPAPATGGTPGAVTSPSSITTPAASAVTTKTGSTPAASNSKVTLAFSGAVVGQMTGANVLTCGSDQSVAGGMQYHVAVLGTVNGQQYALTFAVYPYTHPDTYTKSAFSFFGPSSSNNSVAQWRSSPNLGVSVTINSDGKSGTLEIGYVSSSANTTAYVSGSWECA